MKIPIVNDSGLSKSRGKYKEALLIVAFIFIAALHFSSVNNEINGLGGDNAHYILLGKSLSSFDGYRSFTPGNPLHFHYPPVFPLMLAPVIFLFGLSFSACHLVVVLSCLVSLIFLYLFFRRQAGWIMACFCCVVFSLNYFVNLSLVRILTEFPYLMMTATALLVAAKAEDDNKASLQYLWLPVLVSLVYLTRSAGLSFLIAFLLYRIFRRQFRILILNFPILFIPYVLMKLREQIYGRSDIYISQFWMKNYLDPGLGTISVTDFIERVHTNLMRIGQGICDFVVPINQEHHISVVFLVCALIIGAFILRFIRKQWGLMDVYVFIYLMMLSVWPIYEPRKLMPVMPFIYFYLFLGIINLVNFLKSKKNGINKGSIVSQPDLFAGIICILIIASQVLPTSELIRIRLGSYFFPPPNNQEYRGFSIDWSHHISTYYWVKSGVFNQYAPLWSNYIYLSRLAGQISSPDEVILARKNSLTSLFSGRPAINYPYYNDIGRQRRHIINNGVDYILLDGMFHQTFVYLLPYIKANRNDFEVVAKKGNAFLLKVSKNLKRRVIPNKRE